MGHASGQAGSSDVAGEGETMDNFSFTMLSLTVFIVIFALVVERLTREDHGRKGKPK